MLKYDGVKVSLQQAYSLLLQDDISLLKFKVYASLSRIGYKVFRHKENVTTETQSQQTANSINENNGDKTPIKNESSNNMDNGTVAEQSPSRKPTPTGNIQGNDPKNQVQYNDVYKCYQYKLFQLKHRKLRHCKNDHNFFDSIPDLREKRTVTLKVPDAKYVPENMGLKKSYTINLENFPKKFARTASDAFTYSASDEPNGSHIKRLKSSNPEASSSNYYRRNVTNNFNYQNRPFYSLRPPSNVNFFNINMMFQRPLAHQIFFSSRFQNSGQLFQRPVFFNYSFNMNRWNRFPPMIQSSNRHIYLDKIKQLAQRLKALVAKGNINQQNVQSLQSLINTYNKRYKTNLRLGSCFEIMNGPAIETIELDVDDDEPQHKMQKVDNESLENNLKSLKQTAHELKNLEMLGKATARHRRTFSKLLKTFNKCYNVDYYLDASFEILDRRHITLDSSSDTDCVIQEEVHEKPVARHKKSKKLKNPFNILKRLSEKQDAINEANCSNISDINEVENNNYSDIIKNNISKDWLPNENDFGRAELARNHFQDPLLDVKKSLLLYDFAKFKSSENWLELKLSFLESLKETIAEFHDNASVFQNNIDMECLVQPEDCGSTASILKKLRIIKTNEDSGNESTLKIDFDVYNRDVENFRKSDPPTPHFRIICLE